MEWDDEGLEDEPPAPLLPPEDRLWRHPSEVAGGARTAVRRGAAHAAADAGPPRMVTVVALTSCISVLLTLGVVAVVRPFREGSPAQPRDARLAGDLATTAGVAEVTMRLRPAITQIVARRLDGAQSRGSGVIFRGDGMLLTTHHLVDGAEDFRVLLDDGRTINGRLVGADRDTDIAVLDLEGEGYPTARLAAGRDAVQVGQPAITIGAPQARVDAGPLVRTTVVSAMGQEAGIDGRKFVDMIRTEDAMADGCDGGAVVDRHGRVIGISAANMPTPDGAIGLATPIDVARDVAMQLLDHGRVRRGWLGIEAMTVPGNAGVVVETVLADGPAASAGIRQGDVIHDIDGVAVEAMSDLALRMRSALPGAIATVTVERDGERRTLQVRLGERPA